MTTIITATRTTTTITTLTASANQAVAKNKIISFLHNNDNNMEYCKWIGCVGINISY